ncbi:unnamed protein product [Arabis nemorensis]|uniref:Uncharacterized protein n=1 Tax=Arabis nemorensis TaxID=586526 RepID=A0A565AWN8_9BRAS|nr:unnamed protein product [Arabis nemorensis]
MNHQTILEPTKANSTPTRVGTKKKLTRKMNRSKEESEFGGDYEEEANQEREDREPYEDSRIEDGDSQNRYGDEQWREEEEIIYDGYERESQFSLEEDYFSDETYPRELNHDGETSNEDKPWCEETNSQDNLERTKQYGEETWHHEAESEASFEGESSYGEEVHKPRYITFSCHGHGPEACLRWVRDMEEWFSSNQISEEEKTCNAREPKRGFFGHVCRSTE